MDFLSIVFIGLGLSMDAFAVSITKGLSVKKGRIKNALKIAIFFGVFQALMPLIGYLAGATFSDAIAKIGHWVAFILLSIIGGRMLYESIKDPYLDCGTGIEPIGYKTLIMLAIATSIDALVVGMGFAFLDVSILNTVIIIGIITFIACFIGVNLGVKFCSIFQKKSETLGGIILILIGTKILLEHFNII